VGIAPGDDVDNPVIHRKNVACQVAAFLGSLPSKGQEIDDKLKSNSR
jgi:ribosomal protein S24E